MAINRRAIAMQARQDDLNADLTADGVAPLGVGIGVNTGTFVAGTIGGGGRLEYTVLGDAVNLAQRLQSEAAAGEILAAATTVQAAPAVGTEPIGMKQVKGRTELVETYKVILPAASIP